MTKILLTRHGHIEGIERRTLHRLGVLHRNPYLDAAKAGLRIK
jgi:folate-dependent tRNA-U54 methylase TrmFO/GidA